MKKDIPKISNEKSHTEELFRRTISTLRAIRENLEVRGELRETQNIPRALMKDFHFELRKFDQVSKIYLEEVTWPLSDRQIEKQRREDEAAAQRVQPLSLDDAAQVSRYQRLGLRQAPIAGELKLSTGDIQKRYAASLPLYASSQLFKDTVERLSQPDYCRTRKASIYEMNLGKASGPAMIYLTLNAVKIPMRAGKKLKEIEKDLGLDHKDFTRWMRSHRQFLRA